MTKYEVWMEGYCITGGSAPAMFMGTCEAGSFEEACVEMCGDHPNFNRETLSVWGCGLFDNEADARRIFG
jgi:hypothetical protein